MGESGMPEAGEHPEREVILEVSEQIRLFKEFIEQHYHAQLLEANRKGKESLVISFSDLLKFNTELAEEMIERPEEVLKAAEIAVKEFDLPQKIDSFTVRIKNMPESLRVNVSEVRSKHLGKFLWCIGIVRQKSDVRPHVSTAKFECPSCGNVLTVLQLDQKYKEPTRCSCGRKGKFKELSKELVDGQGLVLEESPDDLDGAQPKRINVFLKGDLVTPLHERRTSPGTKVKLFGWVSEIPIQLRSGGKSTKYDLILEANHIEPFGDDPSNMKISEKDYQEIKKIAAQDNVLLHVANNIAPSIYGHDKIKQSLCLQLAGGCIKKRKDGVRTRGDIHILLIGDPGAGKCVTGDTKIVLENGEIISIREYQEVGERSYVSSINESGLSFTANTTRFWKRDAPAKLLRIRTSTGNEITVTKEHPLFTTEDSLLFARAAEEFSIGDYLALPSKINVQGSLQHVSYDVELSKSRNKVVFSKRNYCDEEFARFLGYLVGDGYVRMRPTTGIVSFTNTDSALLKDFQQLVESLFSLEVASRVKNVPAGYKEVFEYYFSSIEIVRVLEQIAPFITARSVDARIPKIIQRSPAPIVKEFLRSFFGCEGHVRKDRRDIEISSKSKELIEELKLLLLRFGIVSQLSSMEKCATNTIQKIKRKYYRLRISGEDILAFKEEIGFTSPEKQNSLEKECSSKKQFNTNLKVIPRLSKVLKILREKYSLSQKDFFMPRSSYQHYERGDKCPSKSQLQKIVRKYQEIVGDDPLVQLLEEMSRSDLLFDKIVSIEIVESADSEVYDLEIESVHNFIANGIVAHNYQLLKRVTRVAPKARFTSGKGASAAGLTASVVKDEFLGGWSLEAGTLVLANKGFAIIDELDKMTKEDRSALHEAMEQQTVSVSKANVQATLRCETTLLAAANPKFGRFDPYDLVANQINLPPTLINRFDLIFPIKDMPGREKDDKLASFILKLHQNPDAAVAKVESDILKKYFMYVRRVAKPHLSDEAINEIKEYYISMRNSGGGEEGGVSSVPITARQLEALVRLAEASAKLRLAETVTKNDALKSIELVDYCLNQIAKDEETGKIDIDRISSKITSSQRSKISIVKELINEIEQSTKERIISVELIIQEAANKKMSGEDVEDVLEKLRRSGDIFEPKRGFIQKL